MVAGARAKFGHRAEEGRGPTKMAGHARRATSNHDSGSREGTAMGRSRGVMTANGPGRLKENQWGGATKGQPPHEVNEGRGHRAAEWLRNGEPMVRGVWDENRQSQRTREHQEEKGVGRSTTSKKTVLQRGRVLTETADACWKQQVILRRQRRDQTSKAMVTESFGG